MRYVYYVAPITYEVRKQRARGNKKKAQQKKEKKKKKMMEKITRSVKMLFATANYLYTTMHFGNIEHKL